MALTKEKAEEMISELVKKGEMSNEEGKKALENALDRMQEESGKLKIKIQDQVESTLSSMNVAKASDLKKILIRLEELEKKVNEIDEGKEA